MLDVLVVDDDEIVRGCIAEAISGAGHRVVEASDGEEALALLATRASTSRSATYTCRGSTASRSSIGCATTHRGPPLSS